MQVIRPYKLGSRMLTQQPERESTTMTVVPTSRQQSVSGGIGGLFVSIQAHMFGKLSLNETRQHPWTTSLGNY